MLSIVGDFSSVVYVCAFSLSSSIRYYQFVRTNNIISIWQNIVIIICPNMKAHSIWYGSIVIIGKIICIPIAVISCNP